MDSSQFISTDV